MCIVWKNNDKFGKRINLNKYNVEHIQVPNRTCQEERAFLISMPHSSQMLYGISHNSVKVGNMITIWYKVRSAEDCHRIWSGYGMLFYMKLFGKSRSPQNKTSIWGVSPDISYKLQDKDEDMQCGQAKIATQKQKVCDNAIEAVLFVIPREDPGVSSWECVLRISSVS